MKQSWRENASKRRTGTPDTLNSEPLIDGIKNSPTNPDPLPEYNDRPGTLT